MYDVAIIGAGISGAACARVLSSRKLRVALLEAMDDVSMGASRANSAIVHAGYDGRSGTLMARFNVLGNKLYDSWCDELDVPLDRCGSLVLAFDEQQEKELQRLLSSGIENGVPGLEIISGEKVLEMEPHINPAVKSALYARTGGITCPFELTIACCENARENGVDIVTGFKVTTIGKREYFTIEAEDGRGLNAKFIINAAGVYADDIARMIGDDSFNIKPRQGEYMVMDKAVGHMAKRVIFQTPSKMGKGILVSPTVDGNIFAGPTARDSDLRDDTTTTAEGIAELTRMAKVSVPEIPLNKVITSFTGIRAVADTGDFVIGPSKVDPFFINCAGICSPGLTAAPAFAEYIAEILEKSGLEMEPKEGFNPRRSRIKRFADMTDEERGKAIAENPLYGRVICRCETITEAEIVESVRRGARSVDGVKLRCRAGMGRCQGGFCSPRVMEIISREAGMPMEKVTKFGGDSYMLTGLIKEGN